MAAVMAADILPTDTIAIRDWRSLHVASVTEGDWTDHAGPHHGIIAVTRELGPLYPLHFALAEIVQVTR